VAVVELEAVVFKKYTPYRFYIAMMTGGVCHTE